MEKRLPIKYAARVLQFMLAIAILTGCGPATPIQGVPAEPAAAPTETSTEPTRPALRQVLWQSGKAYCPYCRSEVANRSTTCARCTKDYEWSAGRCTDCQGSGTRSCPGGNRSYPDGHQEGVSLYEGRQISVRCKDGKAVSAGDYGKLAFGQVIGTCNWCSGSGKDRCLTCGGDGEIG